MGKKGLIIRIILTVLTVIASGFIGLWFAFCLSLLNFNIVIALLSTLIFPGLIIPLIWVVRGKRRFAIVFWLSFVILWSIMPIITIINKQYDESITMSIPNINVEEYMPFIKDSKIAVLEEESTLKFSENDGTLPIVDGAAAIFPVYSAYVNAVYPQSVINGYYKAGSLNHSMLSSEYNNSKYEPFKYNNTVDGYKALADGLTDIFFGAYPSEQQIEYAKNNGIEFEFTEIGKEAFVFLVNKKNKINGLTTEQIKDIYSGKITNWKEVGGPNKKIEAYQRNESSGSQSQMKRFMGDTSLMTPPKEQVQELMEGLVERVSDYRNKNTAIGYSFRYYVEGILEETDVKLLEVDGFVPTVENIKNDKYPIVGNIYAVTRKDNNKDKINELIEWVLSEQGQELMEKSGYVGVN